MRYLQSQGHEVVAVIPNKEKGRKDIELDDIRKVFVPLRRTSSNPLYDILFFFSLVKVLLRESPDYLFLFTIKPNIYGTLAGRLCGIHSTAVMAGLGRTFTNNSLTSLIARALYRLALTYSDHLLLLNEQDVNDVKRQRICKSDKIIFMKSGEGVNLQQYQYYDNRSDKVKFLFVGRLLKEKGILDYITAAQIVKKHYPEAIFQIAGEIDPNFSSSLKRDEIEKITASGVVEFLGHIVIEEKLKEPGLVLVLPSYYSEGLNHSLMEGCATGKPIITTDRPGCRETVIDGQNGYIVDVKSPKGLADAMMRYLNLSDSAKQSMSQESRRLAEKRFDMKYVFDIYDSVLERVRIVSVRTLDLSRFG